MLKLVQSLAGFAFAAALVAACTNSATAEVLFRYFDPTSQKWETVGSPRANRSLIERELVDYEGPYGANTVVINTAERRLYHVLDDGKAMKYGIGVGREGFQWAGTHRISRKAEWPGWTPPEAMRKRQPDLPPYMEGGPNNPLGARALYLGSTLYRIHGSNEPWTIGHAVSSGCIRMRNEDVIELYGRVGVGTKVMVI